MTRARQVGPLRFIASLAVVLTCARAATAQFECRWADSPIKIDGAADEAAWAAAQVIDNFTLPWLGKDARPAKTATRARLLWDREYLYFFAEMEDSDLFADVTAHDGDLWNNDVFELFFRPDATKPFHSVMAGFGPAIHEKLLVDPGTSPGDDG